MKLREIVIFLLDVILMIGKIPEQYGLNINADNIYFLLNFQNLN